MFLGLAAEDWNAVAASAAASIASVLLSLPFGLALGWMLARRPFRGKWAVETFLNLPLVLPPIVTGYLLLTLLGRTSWIGGILDRTWGIRIAFTWSAVVLAGAVMGFPLMVRSIRLAFQGTDPRLYQAARSLGARPFDAFWSVSLPLARNGVLAGAVLAFARSLGEFGATLMFAANQPDHRTLSLQIYTLWTEPKPGYELRMWLLVIASIVLAAGALAVSEYLERRGARRESA
ncbi:MAG TPA: molybdate ABC transporter permease subunit [Gemmataceae bacterium]|nr:molybdate ABC transporter permease subunit [Gemmataceae bacterium]